MSLIPCSGFLPLPDCGTSDPINPAIGAKRLPQVLVHQRGKACVVIAPRLHRPETARIAGSTCPTSSPCSARWIPARDGPAMKYPWQTCMQFEQRIRVAACDHVIVAALHRFLARAYCLSALPHPNRPCRRPSISSPFACAAEGSYPSATTFPRRYRHSGPIHRERELAAQRLRPGPPALSALADSCDFSTDAPLLPKSYHDHTRIAHHECRSHSVALGET
jgi:hypothetical protein